MKHLNLILFAMMLFVSSAVVAQTDNFNYQAAIRDASGEILENQSVTIVFSIRAGSAAGTEVYAESHTATTNDQGLVNLSIGGGTATNGTFSSIDWPSNSHFLNVEVDGTDMGTSEFKSVPYANYAENAGNVLWQQNSTSAYYDAGRVGIGTDNPTENLEVVGTTKTEGLVIGEGTEFTKMQGGQYAAGTSTTVSKTITVTFPTPFSATPKILANAQGCCNFTDAFAVTIINAQPGFFDAVIRRLDGSSWGQDVQVIWMGWSE